MKKLIPLILLTVLVGCSDANVIEVVDKVIEVVDKKEIEDLDRRVEIQQRYARDFEKAFVGNIRRDELVMCLNDDLLKVFGCANYLLSQNIFELSEIDSTTSVPTFYFTRKTY